MRKSLYLHHLQLNFLYLHHLQLKIFVLIEISKQHQQTQATVVNSNDIVVAVFEYESGVTIMSLAPGIQKVTKKNGFF